MSRLNGKLVHWKYWNTKQLKHVEKDFHKSSEVGSRKRKQISLYCRKISSFQNRLAKNLENLLGTLGWITRSFKYIWVYFLNIVKYHEIENEGRRQNTRFHKSHELEGG